MPTMPAGKTNFTRGYTIALLSAAILSSTAIFIRYITQTFQLPALILAFWRDLFVTVTMLLTLSLVRRSLLKVSRAQLRYLVLFGLVLAAFNSIWTTSVVLNGAAVATMLAYCSGGFTVLLGWWFLRERLDWGKVLAVVLTLSGCALVSGALERSAWSLSLPGILAGILSGLAYAVYTLMGRSASQRGINPWTALVYTFGFATLFLLATNLIPGGFIPGAATGTSDLLWLGRSLPGWGMLLLLAVGPTLLGFGTYNISLVYLPSSVVNLVVTLEPVFTAVIAYFLLGERLTAIQLGGSLLILGGVAILRIYEGRLAGREPVAEEPPVLPQ
jgi:drug/metabolite transporter (DMT)-like permease